MREETGSAVKEIRQNLFWETYSGPLSSEPQAGVRDRFGDNSDRLSALVTHTRECDPEKRLQSRGMLRMSVAPLLLRWQSRGMLEVLTDINW